MDFVALGIALLALLAAIFVHRVGRRAKARGSPRATVFLVDFVSGLLLCFGCGTIWAAFHPSGASGLSVVLRPLFVLGLMLYALGLALCPTVPPMPKGPRRKGLSGQGLLFLLILLSVGTVVVIVRGYVQERNLLARLVLIVAGLVVVLLFALSIKNVRATWRERVEVHRKLPTQTRRRALISLGLVCAGSLVVGFGLTRHLEELSGRGPYASFEHVRSSSSGWISSWIWSDVGSGFLVFDQTGQEVTRLEKNREQHPYAEWSADGERLYFSRPEGPPGKQVTAKLWCYTPSDRSNVFLRNIGAFLFRISPDGRKVLFVRGTQRESGRRTQLICGAMDNEYSDRIICEGGPRYWPATCCFGPRSGKLYFPTFRSTVVPHGPGVWTVDLSAEATPQPKLLFANDGASELACNSIETHLAMLRYVRSGERWRPVLGVAELGSLTTKQIAGRARLVNMPWEDELMWDKDGFRLAFADSEGLKVYDTRTGKVRRLVAAKESLESGFGYEWLVPVMWLPKTELLFIRNCGSFRIFDSESGRVTNSPLTKRIRKWLKRH